MIGQTLNNRYAVTARIGKGAMDAGIALYHDVLRTEHLRVGDNTLALLIDCPYDRAWIYIDLKHVKMPNGKASAFAFKGVTAYLL